MSDLINRQDAIKALEEQLDYLQMLNKDENPKAESKWYGVNWARNTIIELPSADSEVVGKLKVAIESEEICKSCPTAERLSKENLLGAMALGFSYGMDADRPQGKWIFKTVFPNDKSEFPMGYLVCSVCGSHHSNSTPCNYCDNCGARMKGADDEDN